MSTLLMLLLVLTPLSPAPDAGLARVPVLCPLELSPGVPLLRVEVTDGVHAWFVVDTGASGTTVSTALARRLGLRSARMSAVTTIEGSAAVSTVEIPALRVPGLAVRHRLFAAVHDLEAVRRVAPQAEGILGQDVLARYDYLLDFAQGHLALGSFDPPGDGVGLPLSWSAGRPVVDVGGGRGPRPLVLDSGADVLVMEAVASREATGTTSGRRATAALETHAGRRDVEVESHAVLRFADVRLSDVRLVRLPREVWRMAPEVGLLPASYFSRVYVSARTGRAVVWEK